MFRTVRADPRILLCCAAVLALAAGCSDDGVAPQDELPALTAEQAATQAAFLAAAFARLAPEMVGYEPAAFPRVEQDDPATMYLYVFSGDMLSGEVTLEFRREGLPVAYDADPDWARMFTGSGQSIRVTIPGSDVPLVILCDFVADPLTASSAVINGTGSLAAGHYFHPFTLTDVTVGLTGWPGGGTLVFSTDDHTVTVTYSGGDTAQLVVGSLEFVVDLPTGELSLPPGVEPPPGGGDW